MALCRKAGHTWHLAWATYFYGTLLARTGEPEAGRVAFEESIALYGQTGDTLTPAYALAQLGELDLQSGDLDRATDRFSDSAERFRLQGEHLWQGRCHLRLAVLAALRGTTDEASDHLQITRRLRTRAGMSLVDDAEAVGASLLLLAHGRARDAARILGAVGAAIAAGPVPADDARLQAAERRYIAPVRAALGEEAFAAAWAEGCALGLDGVIAGDVTAPAVATRREAPQSAAKGAPAGLSPREVEVLRLLTAGYTNAEIAERLVLSPGTVARHTANIYAKIGARGRADAVAFAVRHSLTEP